MILCRLLFFLQFLCASSALYVFSPRRLQLCFLGIVLCSNLPCYIALASLFQPSSKQFTHHDPRMKETFFRASLGSQQTQLHKPTGLCCVSHSQTCCFFFFFFFRNDFMHEHKLLLSTLKWLILGQIFYNRNCSVCVFCLCDRWLVISLRTMEFFVYGHVRAVQGNTAWSYLQQMIFCF